MAQHRTAKRGKTLERQTKRKTKIRYAIFRQCLCFNDSETKKRENYPWISFYLNMKLLCALLSRMERRSGGKAVEERAPPRDGGAAGVQILDAWRTSTYCKYLVVSWVSRSRIRLLFRSFRDERASAIRVRTNGQPAARPRDRGILLKVEKPPKLKRGD